VTALATTLLQSHVLAQASIDENAVTRTIHVAALASNANDANSGANDKPLKTIQKAISLAGNKPARILVHPGTYREYITLGRGDATLIVEAADPGKVIISGADAVADWKDEGRGVFSLAWKNRWGVNGKFFFPGDRTDLNRRREMVFIEDVRLAQRCNEDNLGSAVESDSLEPGEFTVNEDEQRIYLEPPAGVTLGKTSRVEVSARGGGHKPLVYVADRSNLVRLRAADHPVSQLHRIEFRPDLPERLGGSGLKPVAQQHPD
jgi:hypothetical protein